MPALQAQLEFAKEQTLLWRTTALGLLGAYLALIIGFVTEAHRFNATVVADAEDLFLLNIYTNLQVGLISLFVLIGPIKEAASKILEANQILLAIKERPERAT